MAKINANVNLNCTCAFEFYERQPLGLKPRRICLEERIMDIQNAINRYIEARKPIPKEWIDELSESITILSVEYGKLTPFQCVNSVEYGTHK